MTKKILLTTMVTAFVFSGCTWKDTEPQTKEATAKVTEAKAKVTESTKKVDEAKKTIINDTKKSGIVDPNVKVEPILPESSMKDAVAEKVIESVQ